MKGLKRQIKNIRWRLKINLLNLDNSVLENKWNNFVKQQNTLEKEQRMFKFISKHAQKRLEERFLFRGYTIDDVKNDIKHYKKRERHGTGCTKITGKLGAYIISNEAKVLVTVI